MHQPTFLPDKVGRYAFAALIAANLFLSLGPWMVRLADVGPVAAGFWRLALAIPLLLLLAGRSSLALLPEPRLILLVGAGGLFFAADLAAWHYGIVRTKLANATLFGNMSSFIFALYGFVLMRSWPRPAQTAALGLAALGTALLLGSSYELSPRQFAGDLFAILAGIFYAFYLIAIDRARQALAPLPVLALATVAGVLPLLLSALLLGEKVMPGHWTPLILLSLGSQVIGQGLLVYAIGHLKPVVIAIGLLTQPAVTALIGWLAYGEAFGTADAAGALLICLALVLIRLPPRLASAAREPHLEGDRSPP
jgi:drug/metabolite transporter (DMT)-like permease